MLRRAVTSFMCAPAAGLLSRVLYSRQPKILMYHRCNFSNHPRVLPVSTLETHMRFIRQHCTLMDLDSLCSLARNGVRIPSNTVVVTFDDGYEDAYSCVFPILRYYGIPATFYVVPDFVDQKIWLWPDMLQYVLETTARTHTWLPNGEDHSDLSLSTPEGRHRAFNYIGDYCLTLRPSARRQFILDWARDLGVRIPDIAATNYKSLSWAQMRTMLPARITFGSHSSTHPILTLLDSPQDLAYEIVHSARRIEEMLNVQVTSFAYPNGQRSDYDERTKAMLKTSGYTSAVTAFFSTDILADMYEIKRYGMGADIHDSLATLSGLRYLWHAH